MDTHRVEPLLGTSFLALTQELPSKAMPGSAVSAEGISVKIYPAQQHQLIFLLSLLAEEFFMVPFETAPGEVIPAAGKHTLLRLFSGSSYPTFNQHWY